MADRQVLRANDLDNVFTSPGLKECDRFKPQARQKAQVVPVHDSTASQTENVAGAHKGAKR